MHSREYHPHDAIPGSHIFEEIVTKVKSIFGVHDAQIERESGKLVVHVTDEEMYPGIDRAMHDIGYIPGMGVQ